MTTIDIEFKTCFVCGQKANYEFLGSTNKFGSPDLDLRPPEMYRSTMHTWIQCCDNCGYCCPDISDGFFGVDSVINSSKYKSQKANQTIPELANQFLCWAIIPESEDDFVMAGWAAVYAAWNCDDRKRVSVAKECREKTLSLFHNVKKQGKNFAADEVSENLVLVDLLRRSSQFEVAQAMCEKTMKHKSVEKIMRYQVDLIKKKDINCYSIDEIEI